MAKLRVFKIGVLKKLFCEFLISNFTQDAIDESQEGKRKIPQMIVINNCPIKKSLPLMQVEKGGNI